MDEFIDSCSMMDLIKFDPKKESSSFGIHLLVAMLQVVLNSIIFNAIYKYVPIGNNDADKVIEQKIIEQRAKAKKSKLSEEINDEFSAIKEKSVSPIVFGFSEILNGGIYAPIVEEMFFRFLIFKIIMIKVFKMNLTPALILQAIIFGVMHMTNVITSDQGTSKTILQTISATIGGFLSGFTYVYTNSILTPIMSHMINNIIATSADTIEYTMFYTKQG